MSVLEGPWKHAYIVSNGIKLHYVTQGEGPLLLFLHGFPEFWYSWRHQIPEFARDHRVVALDLRGYNDSDKPHDLSSYVMEEFMLDIEGVIHGLGYSDCKLVGHDWGGAIAWSVATTYPALVSKLGILNMPHPAKFKAGLWQPQQLLKSWYIFAFQIPGLPELLLEQNGYQQIADIFTRTAANKAAFSLADLEAYKDAAARRGALTAMLSYYRNVWKGSLDLNWQPLTCPTLLIWGQEDAALGIELTEGTEAYAPNFRMETIANAGHWVQQEQPHLVNQYLREFLAGNL